VTDPQTLWKTQIVEENNMITLADVRARAARFQAGIRWRNLGLYAYSLFGILVSAWLIASGRFPNIRAPMLLMVAAHLLVLWLINHRISGRPLPADIATQPALDFHRQQLERQAHGLSRAWLWYMMPFIVPFVWDNGSKGSGQDGFGLIDRSNNGVLYPTLLEAIIVRVARARGVQHALMWAQYAAATSPSRWQGPDR